MDELELSGRRHISAKRAAREHRYHSDYIGQLIRSGKVVGQKVGRSWYVDVESLENYFKGELQPVPPATPVAPVVVKTVIEPTPTPISTPAPLPPPAPVVVEKNIEPTVVETKIEITKEAPVQESAPQRAEGLRFVAEETQVVSPLRTLEHDAVVAYPQAFSLQGEAESEPERNVVKPEHPPRKGGVVLGVTGVLAALIIGASASYLLTSRVQVAGESTEASVIVAVP